MDLKWEWSLNATIAAAGAFTIGYLAGRYWRPLGKTYNKKVAKSYEGVGDPVKAYYSTFYTA